MFEEFLGLPLHPLAVHAAVVFVPLLVLVSLAYALVPRVRSRVGWAAALLAVVAPVAALVARQSGGALAEVRGMPVEGDLADHHTYGTYTVWASLALGVLTLALVWSRRAGGGTAGRTWLSGGLTLLVIGSALVSAVVVVLAGDVGSRLHWGEI